MRSRQNPPPGVGARLRARGRSTSLLGRAPEGEPRRGARGKNRKLARRLSLALLLMVCGSVTRVSAQATNVERRALAPANEVAEATHGPKLNFTAGAFFRSPSDHVGFAAAGDFYYDFRLGPLVVAPGARLSAYLIRDFLGIAGYATVRTGMTFGPVVPYLMGGAGFGYVGEEDKEVGFAYLGGGGLMLVLRKRAAVGLEASYQGVTSTDFGATYLGANVQFSYY
jgi:hypothetical protein